MVCSSYHLGSNGLIDFNQYILITDMSKNKYHGTAIMYLQFKTLYTLGSIPLLVAMLEHKQNETFFFAYSTLKNPKTMVSN